MKLYFENSRGEERLIAEVATEEEAFKEINTFLNEHNFKSYYFRTWIAQGRKCVDVGSHTEFFWIAYE